MAEDFNLDFLNRPIARGERATDNRTVIPPTGNAKKRAKFGDKKQRTVTDNNTGQEKKGFDLGEFAGNLGQGAKDTVGAIGRFLGEHPIQASYAPGGENITRQGGFGINTQPLHTQKLIDEGQLVPEQYVPGKGTTYKRPEGTFDPKTGKFTATGKKQTWSFNKNASSYARGYRAKVKAAMRLDPRKAKSPVAIKEIMSDKNLDSNEKYEILRTLDPGLLQLMIEQGITGEG